ncbi:hypothetical protein CHISP_1960 [Chitinispirillum alkaliphilum]|nr:hypothetical protein CHISP_1960 [Chitinispirillum alkaliphilum]
MKKGFYLEQKHRKDVVRSMAKKLADHDETLVFKEKRESRILYLLLPGAFIILFLSLLIFLPRMRPEPSGHVAEVEEVTTCPVLRIEAAYERGEIGANEYGAYLSDVLIRYDSLPAEYRVERPIINPEEVFSRLAGIWDNIRPSLKDALIDDFPHLEKRIAE